MVILETEQLTRKFGDFTAVNALTLNVEFASNAIYPISLMPPWLQGIALVNPLTYLVDALRSLMLSGAVYVSQVIVDLLVLVLVLLVMVTIAARKYPQVVV